MCDRINYLFWKLCGQVLKNSFKTKLIQCRQTRIKQIRNIVTISSITETFNNNRRTCFLKLNKLKFLGANHVNKLLHYLLRNQVQVAVAAQIVEGQRLNDVKALHDTLLKNDREIAFVHETQIEKKELVAQIFLFVLSPRRQLAIDQMMPQLFGNERLLVDKELNQFQAEWLDFG